MSLMYNTNKKHFKIFKKECKYWINKLGLLYWDIYFKQFNDEDNDSLATCNTTIASDKIANICLNTYWGN